MKIAVISTWLPTKDDGVNGVFVLEHAHAVKAYVEEVILIHPYISHSNVFFPSLSFIKEEFQGFEVYRYHLKLPQLKILKWLKKVFFKQNKTLNPKIYNKTSDKMYDFSKMDRILYPFLSIYNNRILNFFIKKMKKTLPENIDIFHSYVAFPSSVLALRLAQHFHSRFIYTEVASDIQKVHGSRVPGWKKYLYELFKKTTSAADIFFCVSQDLLNQFIEMRLNPRNGQVEHTIYDSEIFYSKPYSKIAHSTTAVFCGILNIDNRKGLGGLLEAVALIDPAVIKGFKVKVIGYGNGLEMFEETARQLKVTQYFDFLGKMDLTSIAHEMQSSDFFVIPSFAEGMPCVLIEAMSCGLPVVGSSIGGIKEMVDESVGYQFNPADIQELKEKLLMMIKKHSQYNRQKIAEKVRHASYIEYGKRISDKYSKLM